MDSTSWLKELQQEDNTWVFKKLIGLASSKEELLLDGETIKQWQPILLYIAEIFVTNTEVGKEKVLLASHAFFALISRQSTVALKNALNNFLSLDSDELCFLNNKYKINEPDLFKLFCAYGYLKVNNEEIYSNDLCSLVFATLHRHCIKYTKYFYFAYKILYLWLCRTMDTCFWSICSAELEQNLESIIFSNWHNSLNDISKQNAILVFNLYLRIMEKKYDRFLEFIFKHCIDTLSWLNEIKYVILAEICNVWDNVHAITNKEFLFNLCICLKKDYLRSAGTKVYRAIINKLNEDEWKKYFGCIMKYIFEEWGSGMNKNPDIVRALSKYWLDPTIKKHKNIVQYLWELNMCVEQADKSLIDSYLWRMAKEMHIELPAAVEAQSYVLYKEEDIRLNGFAIYCYQIDDMDSADMKNILSEISEFLCHNANCTSIFLRNGVIKYFKIFLANIFKMDHTDIACIKNINYILDWLQAFFLDCFEIGSCYQRKIFGLNLLKTVLTFSRQTVISHSNKGNENSMPSFLYWDETYTSRFINRKSLFELLRLVLDSALDIKQAAVSIILDYFDKNTLTTLEKQVLYNVALRNCNSPKFYKTESGAALIKVLANWDVPSNIQKLESCSDSSTNIVFSTYSEFFFIEASTQLQQMKLDILKAIVENKPFYGVLTAISKLIFQNGPESHIVTADFLERLLSLVNDATDFLLSVLSSKSESTEYSSSFAEMGLAIRETIKSSELDDDNLDELQLTPAHQLLLSCIWISLKVSCEIASEVGTLMHSDEMVTRSIDIISTVLLKCRHKGVVESAGVAMEKLISHTCKEDKYAVLAEGYITTLLQESASSTLNITRRGAGLSIMFHRLVVGDKRKGRPLMHFAVQKLLSLLEGYSDIHSTNIQYEHDSPWARRLHFLRALVADKDIHAQLVSYMERISLMCFRYLESEVWTIRNASLQLFGTIVPRLAGQGLGSTSLDFGTGYSIDHLVMHYPRLVQYISDQFRDFTSSFAKSCFALHLHSNIVHVLILVSRFSVGGSDLVDYSSQTFITEVKPSLKTCFSSPIYHVRMLAAKAYAALTSHIMAGMEIEKLKCYVQGKNSANAVHGYLLAIQYLEKKLLGETEHVGLRLTVSYTEQKTLPQYLELSRFKHIWSLWKKVSTGRQSLPICYIIETMLLHLSHHFPHEVSANDIFTFMSRDELLVLSAEKSRPGFYQFIDLSMQLYANYVKHTNSYDKIDDILHSMCVHQAITFLSHLSPYVPGLKIILSILFSNRKNYDDILLDTMVDFVLQSVQHALRTSSFWNTETEKSLISLLAERQDQPSKGEWNILHSKLSKMEYILLTLLSEDFELIDKFLAFVLSISIQEEEQTKIVVLEYLKFACHRFEKFSGAGKIIIMNCLLVLVKDEILEIRNKAADIFRDHVDLYNFYPKNTLECMQLRTLLHLRVLDREIIYKLTLRVVMFEDRTFNRTFWSITKILYFIKLWTQNIYAFNTGVVIENPFCHDDLLAYREESKFLDSCFTYTIRNIDRSYDFESRYILEEQSGIYAYDDLERFLNLNSIDYVQMKFRALCALLEEDMLEEKDE